MFGKRYDFGSSASRFFILALSAIRSAMITTNSPGNFFRKLGFIYKERLENVQVSHASHPDITCKSIVATLKGKHRPDTMMLKQHNYDVPVDESGSKTYRIKPFDIMRALAFYMQNVPLPFLLKSERGQAIYQSFLTNENTYIDTNGKVEDISGVVNELQLACSEYDWTQAFWTSQTGFSSSGRDAYAERNFTDRKNIYSSKYDFSTGTGFRQSSSLVPFAGCKNTMLLSVSHGYGFMKSAEFHIDRQNVVAIYGVIKDHVLGNIKMFADSGDIDLKVHGFVGAKYSSRKDELHYGGHFIKLQSARNITGVKNNDHLKWVTDLAIDICDNKFNSGRAETKFSLPKLDARNFITSSSVTQIQEVFDSYDNPNDGSDYSNGCTIYTNLYKPMITTPASAFASASTITTTGGTVITTTTGGYTVTRNNPDAILTPTGEDSGKLKYLNEFLDIYKNSFSEEENKLRLPWSASVWNDSNLLRCPEYVAAVKLFYKKHTSSLVAFFKEDDHYVEKISSSRSPYHVAIKENYDDFLIVNSGYKDGNTSKYLHPLKEKFSEEYEKNPSLFPASWAMTNDTGFEFSNEFKDFCNENKDEIINLALGVSGKSVDEKGLSIEKRPAPECPVIDGVVGMESQVTAFHSAMSANKPSMLVGPTGCGKTFLVRQYHKWDNEERKKRGEAELPLVIHTFHQESSPTEIIGKATLENGNVVWKESEFMKTFSNGGTYFADEFNFAPGGAHAPLFAALNGDEDIFVPEANKIYTRHKDFKFVAACNPASKYGGRQPVDKALASRFFASINFGYLPPAQEKKLLMSRIDTLTEPEAEKVVSYAQAVRKAEAEGHLFIPLGTRDALHIAELLKKGFSWHSAVEYGFAGKSDNEDQHTELLKIAGSAPIINFDDESKLKEEVKKLKAYNAGLQDELNKAQVTIKEHATKLEKFKAALS